MRNRRALESWQAEITGIPWVAVCVEKLVHTRLHNVFT